MDLGDPEVGPAKIRQPGPRYVRHPKRHAVVQAPHVVRGSCAVAAGGAHDMVVVICKGSIMTNRERILKILDGELPDQIPWIPRLSIWYEANLATGTLPARYRGQSLREIERHVFGGTAARDGAARYELDGDPA